MSTFPRHGPREHAAAAASHFATISAPARHVSLGTSSFFVLALLINLPWKFAASFSSNNGNNSPSSPPSQRRLTHSFTRSQFNLARAPATRLSRLLPSLPPSLSPSLAPIAVLALFPDDDRRRGRAAKSTEFVFSMLSGFLERQIRLRSAHARGRVHSHSPDLRAADRPTGDPRG